MSPELEKIVNDMANTFGSIIDSAYEMLMAEKEFAALSENQRIALVQRLILRANMRYLTKMPYTMHTNDQIDEALETQEKMLNPEEVKRIIEGINRL